MTDYNLFTYSQYDSHKSFSDLSNSDVKDTDFLEVKFEDLRNDLCKFKE